MQRGEQIVSIDALRLRVRYDADTGELRWADRVPASEFIDDHGCSVWHGKFAGKPVRKRTRGYVIVSVSIDGHTYYLQGHRVAWALMTGSWPAHEIDHRNRVCDDNRWINLREATRVQNSANRGANKNNRSGFKGVYRRVRGKPWAAQIRVDGRTRFLGAYDTPEEAFAVHNAVAQSHHGEFAAVI